MTQLVQRPCGRVEMVAFSGKMHTRDAPEHETLGPWCAPQPSCVRLLRRYLVYDVVMVNGRSLVHEPWEKRFEAVNSDIMKPRNLEKAYIAGQIKGFTGPPMR